MGLEAVAGRTQFPSSAWEGELHRFIFFLLKAPRQLAELPVRFQKHLPASLCGGLGDEGRGRGQAVAGAIQQYLLNSARKSLQPLGHGDPRQRATGSSFHTQHCAFCRRISPALMPARSHAAPQACQWLQQSPGSGPWRCHPVWAWLAVSSWGLRPCTWKVEPRASLACAASFATLCYLRHPVGFLSL